MDQFEALWTLWGKAQRAPEDVGPEWHPLVCHMLDVMNVADVLLERLPETTQRMLLDPLGGGIKGRRWLRLLVALHDMGKATPGFQRKWPGNLELQRSAGLPNEVPAECDPHGITGTAILSQCLQSDSLMGAATVSATTALALARAVASHHGEFARDRDVAHCARGHLRRQFESGVWPEVHKCLARTLMTIALAGERLHPLLGALELDPAFMLLLTGITCVADWLGSNAEVFRYEACPVDADRYQASSRQRAEEVLAKTGWHERNPRAARTFVELFPFPPRSLQINTEAILGRLNRPALLIIESTMGDGKTEAALLVAETLGRRVGHEGMYIGLPTQATSNQMLGRVEAFLERNSAPANLQLVHGDAILSKRFEGLRLRAIYGRDAQANNVAAEVWFSQSKRSLLATYAVGTIDQALLGVMQTRHAFVRLFGLAGKTVVLDEVHAYDAYTSEILFRLVEWLSVLGSTVVILSATLPRLRRERLIAAYGASVPSLEAPYPRITAGMRNQEAISMPTEPSRPAQEIALHRHADDTAAIARHLAQMLDAGGTAAWICNSVGRAQAAFVELQRLRDSGDLPAHTALNLLHSRFLRKDRQIGEQRAEALYGPRSVARPAHGILVGTQVLEQSLDLDFDVMISDLCPIDLLLQRAGRLHRHQRSRPPAHALARLWVVMPDEQDGVPSFASIAFVYAEGAPDVMLRTWLELRGVDTLRIPDELETWIERVYGDLGRAPKEPPLATLLKDTCADGENLRASEWTAAKKKVFISPADLAEEDRLGDVYSDLKEDEDDKFHVSMKAATRLGDPSTDLVCLWGTEDSASLDREGTEAINIGDPKVARRIVEHSVKIQDRTLFRFQHLITEPESWRAHPALRHKKLLLLNAATEAEGIRLDPDLGLVTS